MILVKSEPKIAENYDIQLVKSAELRELGTELREKLEKTREAIDMMTEHSGLPKNNPILMTSMSVRNPYVDNLNIVQAELLRRLRYEGSQILPSERQQLQDALLITINGIANGMRNSG